MISLEQTDLFGPVIHAYTRSQAVRDGVQVPVLSVTSREAGLLFPVYLTRAVFDRYVTVPRNVEGQDLEGRLWDVLYMTAVAIRSAKRSTDPVTVELFVRNDNRRPRRVQLLAVVGAKDIDDPQPAITIQLAEEN